jgi:hypothetical protein
VTVMQGTEDATSGTGLQDLSNRATSFRKASAPDIDGGMDQRMMLADLA